MVVVGVIGIVVFAEMSGRVVAVSGRPTFDIVRERLGPRMGLLNLFGSMAVTLLTYTAEIGGMALALELGTSVWSYFWIPFTAAAVWIALFGAAMTPYEVFFFSSGGIEERWTPSHVPMMRANVFVGFPLGGTLSLAIAACAAVVLLPAGIEVGTLGQVALPVSVALGQLGLAVAILGFFAATFGAACETGLSVGYSIAQYFGWQWGKAVRPRDAARFHAVVLLSTVLAGAVLLTTIDPILVTEFSVVFSAVALPLTYLPILIVANDPEFMGSRKNKVLANVLGIIYLVLVLAASLAALPLMIWTKLGTT